MKVSDLREEVTIELEAMQLVVTELATLRHDIGKSEPTLREKTAAAAFMAQFYNGIENILKRICVYYDQPLPTGELWHVDLFRRFAEPAHSPLPLLFDEDLAAKLAPYRRFRHVVMHSYGFQIDWRRMREGVGEIDMVFSKFRDVLERYLQTIEE